MKVEGSAVLKIGAFSSFALALLHVIVIAVGARAYLYFGAADLAELASRGSPAPTFLTSFLTAAFIIFGLYALAGAGVIRRPPLVRGVLVAVGAVYTLRGLVVVLDVVRLSRGAGYPVRQTVFSAVSLVIGLLYLAGVTSRWHELKVDHDPVTG